MNEKDKEVKGETWDPERTEDPALLYVLERWGEVGDSLVIEGRISTMTVTCELKRQGRRQQYDSDSMRSYVKLDFDNPGSPFKCDLVVRHPQAEVVSAGGDLGIVEIALRQLSAVASRSGHQAMVEHQELIYSVPVEHDKPAIGGVTLIGGAKAKNDELL